mmetsp:Transcript_1204/g.1963  ORF Transcript_1204/g.1963 Transcript_1204/m.1963 type:complete len:154 (+) Transcript_1204:45-506(+)
MEHLSRVVFGILGVFEFVSAASFYFNAAERVLAERLTPAIFAENFPVKVLFCSYLITLGVQRLSWSLGSGGCAQWILMIVTHLTEWTMWCCFATGDDFRRNLTNGELFVEIATVKSPGGVHAAVVVVGVPLLILLLLLTGPGRFGKKKETKLN